MAYQAKKHLGQHFLSDKAIISKIIQSIPRESAQCVEIGAGLGDLTQELLNIESLIAYEVDRDLCSLLCEKFSNCVENGRLQLINKSVLDIAFASPWLYNGTYKVVSNLPYYIATRIVLQLLRDRYCQSFVVMTQKEVAEKFCSKCGDSAFGALSVIVESVGEASLLFNVPKEAFNPMPKVSSSVFIVRKYGADSKIYQRDFSLSQLENFLKCAFCAPRKQLLKNLAQRFDKSLILEAFKEANIPQNARPHEVSSAKFHHLLTLIKKQTYI